MESNLVSRRNFKNCRTISSLEVIKTKASNISPVLNVDYSCGGTDTFGIDYMHVIHATMTNKERYGNCKCTKISPGISELDGETYPSSPRPPQPDFGASVRYTVCPERNTRMTICPFNRCQQPAHRRSKTHIFVLVYQFSHRLHRRRNDFRRQVPKLDDKIV